MKTEQLTIFDYFAGQALNGYLASLTGERLKLSLKNWENSKEVMYEKYIAILSYDIAVQMIAEKQRRESRT